MSEKPTLILASGSRYRQQLLHKLQLPFCCHSPDIDESHLPDESAQQLVERLAISKAKTVARCLPDTNCLIIGSDQVAVLDDTILTKPGNHHNATQQLQSCSGRSVQFVTGLCLFNKQTRRTQYSTEVFNVSFRTLTAAQIEHYLLADQPYDCAGSFKAEGLGISLFEKMQGDDPNTLIGLPLIRLVDFLQNEGVSIPPAN